MNNPTSLALIAIVGIGAFIAGNRTLDGSKEAGTSSPDSGTRSADPRAGVRSTASDREDRTPTGRGELSSDDARRLTPEERIALLNKAALLADPEKQANIICGLISAMSKDELGSTTEALLEIQSRGNAWSQAVWNSLWTQWGRIDPQTCLELSAHGSGLNTGADYRCLMSGWLETDPGAALEWANRPGLNDRESIAAAFAISHDAGTDLGRLQSAILAIPDNPATARAALHDYFDLALASGEDPALSAVYDRMDPALRQVAWPVMMQRLAYTDPEQAVAWLRDHATDPGRDYRSIERVLLPMAVTDPAGMVSWASRLPVPKNDDPDAMSVHPALLAVNRWMKQDPSAARAWLQTQPADTPWSRLFSPKTPDETAAEFPVTQ